MVARLILVIVLAGSGTLLLVRETLELLKPPAPSTEGVAVRGRGEPVSIERRTQTAEGEEAADL